MGLFSSLFRVQSSMAGKEYKQEYKVLGPWSGSREIYTTVGLVFQSMAWYHPHQDGSSLLGETLPEGLERELISEH